MNLCLHFFLAIMSASWGYTNENGKQVFFVHGWCFCLWHVNVWSRDLRFLSSICFWVPVSRNLIWKWLFEGDDYITVRSRLAITCFPSMNMWTGLVSLNHFRIHLAIPLTHYGRLRLHNLIPAYIPSSLTFCLYKLFLEFSIIIFFFYKVVFFAVFAINGW